MVRMRRSVRLDAPGVLHHVMGRGMEKGEVFLDEHDRADFINRLEKLPQEGSIDIYARPILPNHVHILRETMKQASSSSMRKLLRGK